MEDIFHMDKKSAVNYVIVLSGMFILSALLLAVMSAIIWKTNAGAGAVSGCITAVYIISNFVGGFMVGRKAGKHKFLWGIAASAAYFAIIVVAGVWFMGNPIALRPEIITGALICVISGMFGGMLAP